MGIHDKDMDEARRLYTRACELGEPQGCWALGYVYEQGRGTPKDAELAAQVLERGCFDLQDSNACRYGGGMFSDGRHLEKNALLARKFNEHGCSKLNDTMCCTALGRPVPRSSSGTGKIGEKKKKKSTKMQNYE